MEETKANSRFIIRGLASAYALYSLWRIAQSYFAGGADAPTLTMVLAAAAVLGGGALIVLWLGYKEWKAAKKAVAEALEAEQAEKAAEAEPEDLPPAEDDEASP